VQFSKNGSTAGHGLAGGSRMTGAIEGAPVTDEIVFRPEPPVR
jgi:hypothetical protein